MSAICSVCEVKCKEDSSDVKCCGICKRVFHAKCLKEEEGVKTRSGGWVCKTCKKGTGNSTHGNSTSTESTPISKEFLISVMETFKKEIFSEIQTFRKEILELQESVNFLSGAMDANSSLMKSIQTNIITVNQEVNELRAENAGLRAEVDDIKERLRAQEQYSRRCNIEISGIPETREENPVEIVKDVGKALGIVVEDSQVAAAHRIPTFKRDRIPSLVVQFQQKTTRDIWIAKYKEKRTLIAKDVNSAFPPQKVFVNEHLSPENKIFLAKLKAKSKELSYEFAWCRDGKFFVRRSSGERCKRVSGQRELDQLK